MLIDHNGYLKFQISELFLHVKKFKDLLMPEDLLVNIRFKNRKTGELKDGYVRVPDIEKYANGLKKYFDIHEFRICEKRIVSKEEFEKKGKG
ncbi:MAG: hypothetical protein CVV24_00820 [Ignavibacteriae bacterium HGW-Ignavibacteriae-3]|nr:MAG: hypothetical protein CVV24_00820 [Ignavibacteriae bacterium HGW-Ignavibacteriae-3]